MLVWLLPRRVEEVFSIRITSLCNVMQNDLILPKQNQKVHIQPRAEMISNMKTFKGTLNQRKVSAAVYKGQWEAFPGTSLFLPL